MESTSEPLQTALFPIPNLVAFPGTTVPLHVFEPRYRQLVNDCVKESRMVGISHVVKTIHDPGRKRTPEQALRSNQATYQPQRIFSAGHCEILETTPDGRLLAKVDVVERLVLLDEIQSLPYRIVTCQRVPDNEVGDSTSDLEALQTRIHNRLIELIRGESQELAETLSLPSWRTLSPADYSFKVFQFFRLDPDVMQSILEERDPAARLKAIWMVLSP